MELPVFETLELSWAAEHVINVAMNRPRKLNAMNLAFWRECRECFEFIARCPACRAVVLSGHGKHFTAGLDLQDTPKAEEEDPARTAMVFQILVRGLQAAFSAMELCPQPVIAAVHGACIGGGIDMITAADIRLCSSDASFSVKEVDIGVTADVGTLARLPKVIRSESAVRELCLTARRFGADEALSLGLVSRVLPSRDALMQAAVDMASVIAAKSPLAIAGTKHNLIFARDHSVRDALDHVLLWNGGMVQTDDIIKAATSHFTKEVPEFSPLWSRL